MPLLPDAESFKRLVEGTDTTAAAGIARLALTPLGAAWSTVMAARNLAYDRGWLPSVPAEVPVVGVGNLTLGGTGKTPLVAWVVRRLQDAGRTPAIVSRGYAAAPGQRSDEAAELGILLPGVRHVADRDRVAAAAAAVTTGADVVVLDDGFQHRRLARDLDLVAVDATDPFGCGHVFPRGLLRERLSGLTRAEAVILTRAGNVSAARREEIRDRLAEHCGGALPGVWAEASHAPVAVRDPAGTRRGIEWLAGRRIGAFAGIGNPSAFRSSLESLGADVIAFRPYPDHHPYSPADLADLADWAKHHRVSELVTTLKDLVKLPADVGGDVGLSALEIAMVIEAGERDLGRLVDRVATVAAAAGAHPTGRRGESIG
jgi:tetraacyldisaccharide 4'-kinase